MRHITAYLLLQIGGNTNPSAEDVKRVLAAVGIEADDARLAKLIQKRDSDGIYSLFGLPGLRFLTTLHPLLAGHRVWIQGARRTFCAFGRGGGRLCSRTKLRAWACTRKGCH